MLGGLLVEIANPTEDDLQPGDWVYFANNPNYLLKHSNGPWQGENAIYVGDNAAGEKLYSGFGVHEHTAAQMAASMMRAYNAEPSAASRAPERRRAAWFADPANTSSLHVSEAKAHERLAEVARDLQLDPNEIDWDVSEIQDGIWELYLDYTPPSYPETITIDEVRGLVQCLRIDVDALANLCREIDADQPLTYAPAPASPVTATASAGAATGVGLAGVLGGLGN